MIIPKQIHKDILGFQKSDWH